MESSNISKGKKLKGVVVSDKMKDTATVLVTRFVKHPKYGKYLKKNKKFKAHDVGNTSKTGDTVLIIQCRPISKDKSFMVVSNESLKNRVVTE